MTGPKLPRLAECDRCHDPIRFVQCGSSWIPVQPLPHPKRAGAIAAQVVAGKLVGHWIGERNPAARADLVFVPHRDVCSANRPPLPEPSLFDTTTEENDR